MLYSTGPSSIYPGKPLQPNLMFMGEAEAYPPERCSTQISSWLCRFIKWNRGLAKCFWVQEHRTTCAANTLYNKRLVDMMRSGSWKIYFI
jgi:hypothetical protein